MVRWNISVIMTSMIHISLARIIHSGTSNMAAFTTLPLKKFQGESPKRKYVGAQLEHTYKPYTGGIDEKAKDHCSNRVGSLPMSSCIFSHQTCSTTAQGWLQTPCIKQTDGRTYVHKDPWFRKCRVRWTDKCHQKYYLPNKPWIILGHS